MAKSTRIAKEVSFKTNTVLALELILVLLLAASLLVIVFYGEKYKIWITEPPMKEVKAFVTLSSDLLEDYKKSMPTKLITYYNRPPWISLKIFDRCEYKCQLRSSRYYQESDVVVFHGPTLHRSQPLKKYPGQIWVFHDQEPPFLVPNFKNWKRLFNWTISYRRDADIFNQNYCFIKTTDANRNVIARQEWENKEESLGWIVSHCGVPSRRLKFSEELKKYIGIDIYGRCGSLKCDRKFWEECFKKNKFYASFENQLCVDYITEKSLRLFERNVNSIPVTRGASNYSMYLPPGSYVNTDNFSTIQELSNYLKKLSKSKELYLSYFQWRKFYKIKDIIKQTPGFCELCKRIHTLSSQRYQRLYEDIDEWVRKDSLPQPSCRVPKDIGRRKLLRL